MNKGKGLLALVGLAAGAFAFWKYNQMSPEEKKELKNKVKDTGRRIKKSVGDVESTISEKYDTLKNKTKQEFDDVTS